VLILISLFLLLIFAILGLFFLGGDLTSRNIQLNQPLVSGSLLDGTVTFPVSSSIPLDSVVVSDLNGFPKSQPLTDFLSDGYIVKSRADNYPFYPHIRVNYRIIDAAAV